MGRTAQPKDKDWLIGYKNKTPIYVTYKKVKVKVKSLSPVQLFVTPWTVAYQLLPPWDSPGKSTGVGCHFLLQGIFLTQGSNSDLPHSRHTLEPLSHQGSPSLSTRDPPLSTRDPPQTKGHIHTESEGLEKGIPRK